MLRRVAGPMARHPLMVLVIALVACAGMATGFVRYSIDAGQSLLVGSNSSAGQANQRFTQSFGTDPIVVVLTAGNPTAPYLEKNLQRLTALEQDLAHDPRVSQVLGPGTVANAALSATTAEVSKVLTEYPTFVAETAYLDARQKGQTDATTLQTQFQSNYQSAQQLLELLRGTRRLRRAPGPADVRRGSRSRPATASSTARRRRPRRPWSTTTCRRCSPSTWRGRATPRTLRARARSSTASPPRSVTATAPSRSSCQITPTCQIYLARILLDLPNCPTEAAVQAANAKGQELFCMPKSAWAAVLPTPSTTASGAIVAREVITVRLTAAAAADRSSVLAIRQKISDELTKGISSDSFTKSFTSAQFTELKQLGPLAPSDCGGATQQQDANCYSRFHDRPFQFVIAGAPLLTYGVVDAMSQTLLILLPVVMVLMAILLVVTFRVRGRLWPLLAAVGAGGSTVGLSLWLGIPVTPAVLAGVPVLVGLAVDYAVQLVARYDEQRRLGADRSAAIEEAMLRSGPATFTAAVATLAGFGTLMVFAGIDAGPLVAIPLVAEFALVLFVGVIISWLAALFVALPAAALWGRSRPGASQAPVAPRPAARTLGIASAWRGAVVPAIIVALIGWILLPRVPVQTQVDQLLASSLPQLQDVNTVRDQTGFGNEVDIFVQGQVAGPYNQAGTPANVTWQCQVSQGIRSLHADQVALATSIADFFIAASSSSSTASTSPPCVSAPAATNGGGASPSPGASPSAAASPARHRRSRRARRRRPPRTEAPGRASSSPPPLRPPRRRPRRRRRQPRRRAPPRRRQARLRVRRPRRARCRRRRHRRRPRSSATCACSRRWRATSCNRSPTARSRAPPSTSTSTRGSPPTRRPINPSSARIVIGVQSTSIADEARLIDSIRNEIASPPNGMTAAPAGIAALAAQAYDNILSRSLLLNLLPLVVVFLALLAIERDIRRAVLPLLPTAIAAGWAPLILLLLGLLPGNLGATLGSFNPLTVVLGALVIALATEFGVVLLRRFDEECAKGIHPDDAAAATLAVTGKAIRVSALTLGAGFAVLAISALFPHGLPLLGAFGLTVLIDLGLAVAAVFGIMLPVAVAIERSRYEPGRVAVGGPGCPRRPRGPDARPPPPRPAGRGGHAARRLARRPRPTGAVAAPRPRRRHRPPRRARRRQSRRRSPRHRPGRRTAAASAAGAGPRAPRRPPPPTRRPTRRRRRSPGLRAVPGSVAGAAGGRAPVRRRTPADLAGGAQTTPAAWSTLSTMTRRRRAALSAA